jgi:hypothetical protein
MDFEEALVRLGFEASHERSARGGARMFSARPNRYLTYWVHAFEDGTALFTWEFAIADYLSTAGIQVGSNEALNTFMYPEEDFRGPQDGAWLAEALDQVEGTLQRLRFDAPEESRGE